MKLGMVPLINILGKKNRAGALILFATILSFCVFSGSVIFEGLKRGLENLELRLGADIVVVPYEASQKKSYESIVLDGNCTYFYMERSVLDKVRDIEGVEKASPQLFLASLSAGCCSVDLQLMGFEPESDFTIQPWIQRTYKGKLEIGDILVGSKVEIPDNRILRFYNTDCKVVGQLAPTGNALDAAVYANIDTIKLLTDASIKMGKNITKTVAADSVISSVQIDVEDGYDIDDVVNFINKNIEGVYAVKAKSMTSSIGKNLSHLSFVMKTLLCIVWILCFAVMITVFTLIMNERKKEFAVMRAIGASRKKLCMLVFGEALIENLIGTICGLFVSLICVIPFQISLEQRLKLPFLLPSVPGLIILCLVTVFVSLFAGSLSASLSAYKITHIDTALILRDSN